MFPASKPRRHKPLVIKQGNVSLKIYEGQNRVNGTAYPQFTLVYYIGAQRIRKRFVDLAEAKKEAIIAAKNLARGDLQALKLTSADREVYMQAIKNLRPFSLPLNVAVAEYVAAKKLLSPGATLKEAIEFFNKRSPGNIETRTARQVADEMLAAKRVAKLSAVHLRDLESRLNRFCAVFQININGISGTMLQAWLDDMKGSGRTKQNYLRVVASLFRFAIKRKYLAKDSLEEIEAVQQAKADSGEIEIFTSTEMNEILAAARPEMVPWLAIAGFAGLRSAELHRLDWGEVNLEERHIEIKASKAKTAARRLAPITDNLAAWLAPHKKPSGKITGFESWWNQIPKVVEAVNEQRRQLAERSGKPPTSVKKFIWKHNALRHSFCSYRLAAIKNAAQVALEAGNSPQMIFKHYRQLVTEAEANKWFAIIPANVMSPAPIQAITKITNSDAVHCV